MFRHLSASRRFTACLGLVLAVCVCAARSEKIWAQCLNGLMTGEACVSNLHQGTAPFDPRRVPQSGGMASRLLAGLLVKHE